MTAVDETPTPETITVSYRCPVCLELTGSSVGSFEHTFDPAFSAPVYSCTTHGVAMHSAILAEGQDEADVFPPLPTEGEEEAPAEATESDTSSESPSEPAEEVSPVDGSSSPEAS